MDLSAALTVGERIADSRAPTLALAIVLLVVAYVLLWITVRRQRKWIAARLTLVTQKLGLCEASHLLARARDARKTLLMLQTLTVAETVSAGPHRKAAAAKVAGLRERIEALLAAEMDEAGELAEAKARAANAELPETADEPLAVPIH